MTQGAEFVKVWRKKAPILAKDPRRWNKATGLRHFLFSLGSGLEAHQVSGKRQTPVPLLTVLCSTRRRSSTASPENGSAMERAAGHSLDAGVEIGIMTDFAKKARSQLIRERQISWLHVGWTFLLVEPSTNSTCLWMDLFPISFSVRVATR